jgi:hypothetical protein
MRSSLIDEDGDKVLEVFCGEKAVFTDIEDSCSIWMISCVWIE